MYIVRMKRRPIKRTRLFRFNNRQADKADAIGAPGFWYLHPTKGWRWERI